VRATRGEAHLVSRKRPPPVAAAPDFDWRNRKEPTTARRFTPLAGTETEGRAVAVELQVERFSAAEL
jgi:hypothetical protein